MNSVQTSNIWMTKNLRRNNAWRKRNLRQLFKLSYFQGGDMIFVTPASKNSYELDFKFLLCRSRSQKLSWIWRLWTAARIDSAVKKLRSRTLKIFGTPPDERNYFNNFNNKNRSWIWSWISISDPRSKVVSPSRGESHFRPHRGSRPFFWLIYTSF